MIRPHHSARALTLCLTLLALLVGSFSTPASAHAYLIATEPPAGYSVPTAPERISLTFTEPVTAGTDAIALRTVDGPDVSIGPSRRDPTGKRSRPSRGAR